jgi:hypothetical protein
MSKTSIWAIASLMVATILVAGVGDLVAGVEQKFAGRIFILKKRPPSYFKSQGAFASFLRNNSIKTVHANEDNEWEFRTFTILKRKLGDYEVEMVFYDIDRGKSKSQRKFVDSFTQMTQDRNTRTLEGKVRLTRPQFDANIDYMVVAQAGAAELATGYFHTKGMSQEALDEQQRIAHEQAEMEKSMKELEAKAKQQEEDDKLRAQGIDPEERRRKQKAAEMEDDYEAVTVEATDSSDDPDHPGQVDPRESPRGCGCSATGASRVAVVDLIAALF